MSYATLQNMPCRKPCDRYYSNIEEDYDYEPTENYTNPKKFMFRPDNAVVCDCNCGCNQFEFKNNNSKNNLQLPENFETGYEQRISTESFKKESDCGCAKNNPPYRIETCNYNQSPSWITQKMFQPPEEKRITESFQSQKQDENCGCGVQYIKDDSEYNRSDTWKDQGSFRDNTLYKF